jgi:hypothetical protein
MIRRTLGVALLAGLVACASGTAGSRPLGARDFITAAEINETTATSALDAVRLLRPHFLRSRGVRSTRNPVPSEPVVYVDGVHHGDLSSLERIRAQDVAEIRLLSATDATTRYGSGHAGGVIAVTTRS